MNNPFQPIRDSRFKENKIVSYLLDAGGLNMNDLAIMEFSNDDRVQFAQLIGYSLCGFGGLSYVSDEAYDTAKLMDGGVGQLEAENQALRSKLEEIRKGLKISCCAAFRIHEDDLNI